MRTGHVDKPRRQVMRTGHVDKPRRQVMRMDHVHKPRTQSMRMSGAESNAARRPLAFSLRLSYVFDA